MRNILCDKRESVGIGYVIPMLLEVAKSYMNIIAKECFIKEFVKTCPSLPP